MELRCLGGLSLEAEDGRSLHSVVTQGKRVALLVYLLLARHTSGPCPAISQSGGCTCCGGPSARK